MKRGLSTFQMSFQEIHWSSVGVSLLEQPSGNSHSNQSSHSAIIFFDLLFS